MARPKDFVFSEESRLKMSEAAKLRTVHGNTGKRTTTHGHRVESKRREITRRAADRGIEWSLSDEEASALIVGDCRYCGKKSVANADPTLSRTNAAGLNGIDRVDSSLGYAPSNVVACCYRCNSGKHTQTHDEFVAWIKLVHSRLT